MGRNSAPRPLVRVGGRGRRRLLAAFGGAFICSIALLGVSQAQNPFTNEGDVATAEGPRARLKPDEIRLTVSEADCRRLVATQPRDDVAYQPGVDVRGKATAPADLPGSTGFGDRLLDKEIAFDLAINPLLFAGDPQMQALFGNASVSLGRVAVDPATGEATLDGEALTDPQTAAVAKACRARLSH